MVLDTVWMITHSKMGVIYAIGVTAPEAWEKAVKTMGTADTQERLYRRGWRARKVNIVLEG